MSWGAFFFWSGRASCCCRWLLFTLSPLFVEFRKFVDQPVLKAFADILFEAKGQSAGGLLDFGQGGAMDRADGGGGLAWRALEPLT